MTPDECRKLELFPQIERERISNQILCGLNTYSTPAIQGTSEKILRLKQLLLKYTGSSNVREQVEKVFHNGCPLCQSYLHPLSIRCCEECPWNDLYDTVDYACERWAEQRDIGTAEIYDYEEVRLERVEMIYNLLARYTLQLERE